MASESKSKDIKSVLAQINKEFGDGAIMSLGEFSETTIDCIPTGSIGLDIALGGKGVPKGRIIELIGGEASGKTSLALHIAANVQKMGGSVAFIDAEHALDSNWAEKIGVDLTKMFIAQPSNGEEGLQIAEMCVSSGSFDLLIVDSVAALVPKKEIENDIGDATMGLHAKLMSQALRVLNPAVSKTNTCLIFINQYRQKIGVLYGDPNIGTGGLGLKYFASVRVELRATTETTKDTFGDISAKGVKAKVLKNKIAPPLRTTEFFIRYDSGIDGGLDILKHAIEMDVITKKGAFYSYGEQRIGHGELQAVDFLASNPTIKDKIYNEVVEAYKNRKPDETKESSEEE